MRAFVALDVPAPEVVESMTRLQESLRQTRADIKLVERENLHFTVKFLGEISDAQASEVDRRLRALSLGGAVVQVHGVGAFPSASRPRVIWVGVSSGAVPLEGIGRTVIGALKGIGEEDARGFQPHITLGRVRSSSGIDRLVAVLRESADLDFGTVKIGTMKLKSSVLRPSGPVYTDIGVYALS